MFDVVVVGGGLLGAAIARDAAQRGLSVALFEAQDYGAGGSSRGSRLALGGLSALGTLDFTRVREDIREREILLQTAPHLVRPQPCLIPFYSHGLLAQARLRAGLALSDALGFDHALRVHQLLSVREAQTHAPGLGKSGLLGAARVWEAAASDTARLARELAFDARRAGAALFPHTQVEALRRGPAGPDRERVGGVRWKALSGETGRTDAALVVLAAGRRQEALFGSRSFPLQKTISIFGPFLAGGQDALAFPQEEPPSLLLAAPQEEGGWAGGGAAEYQPGDPAYATGAEVAALVSALQAALPGLSLSDVQSASAAVHAQAPPGEEVCDPAAGGGRVDGLVSASGAELTQFRRVAEEAVDLACRKLGRSLSAPPCRTSSALLPDLPSASGSVPEMVQHAVVEEDCLTLRDFLERRTPPDWDQAERTASLPDALNALGECLRWSAARRAAEVRAWEAELALGQTFRVL